MPIQFTNWPALLLLPALLPYFWWQHRRTVTDMSPLRKRLALTLRVVIVILLVMVLAGARRVKKGDSLAVLFVADASKSVRSDQKQVMETYLRDAVKGMRKVDKVGLITFGQNPHTQSSIDQPFDATRLSDSGQTTATDISQALRLARNELDTTARDSGKRIVLLSDGNENIGRALGEVPDLTAGNIVLDTITLPVGTRKEVLVEKTIMPARVKIGEPFQVRVVVNSLSAQPAVVALMRDNKPASQAKRVELHPGKNVVVFEQNVDKPGFVRYGVSLDAQEDEVKENNRGEGFVAVRGKPSILYVGDDPAPTQFLRRALAGQNITVDYTSPDGFPATAAALQRYDSILFSNVPRFAFSDVQLNALQVSTRDFGVGFAMIGGEQSYGVGAYRQSVIEDMLPVSMDIRKMQRFPSVAVATAIDRSGSMGEGSPKSKLELALDAATRTVRALKPSDKLAVIAFEDTAEVRVPLTDVEKGNEIIAQIQRINIGGGTSVYSGVSLAYETIKDAPVPIKHLIILTDGMSQDPDYTSLINNMKVRKITVTGVVIGGGTQEMYGHDLAKIAKATGGRFYVVNHEKEIPGIYLQEIERISSKPIEEGPFLPQVTDMADAIIPGGAWQNMPLLLGYNVVQPKPTADVLLLSPKKDPILTTWRYGLGRVAAFTSDDRNRWAAHWLAWANYPRFWAELVRWTLRSNTPSEYATQVTMEGNRGHVVVDAIDKEGKYVNRLSLRTKVSAPDERGLQTDAVREEPLRQTGPGRYEAWFDAPQIGTYLVNVLQKGKGNAPDASTVIGLSTAYSPEYRDTQSNDYLMGQLAQAGNGRENPPPAEIFGGERPGVYAAEDLTENLLRIALFLLLFDIAVRRLAIDPADLRRGLEWLRGRIPQQSNRAATPELSRLRDRKDAVVAAREEAMRSGATNDERPTTKDQWATTNTPTLNTQTPNTESRTPASPPLPRPVTPPPVPAPEAVPSQPEPTSEEAELAGMSRLMAAKRRAQERQNKEQEE